MSVTINKTDGTVLVTIADGSIDTGESNLALIGRLYKNYGELVNENFVKLLENFANTTSPITGKVLEGQLWYDKSERNIKVYRSTGFIGLARITSTPAEPGNPRQGDLWYDTSDAQLKLFTGSAWQVIAPTYTAAQGKTGAYAETIVDTTSGNHVAVVIWQQGTIRAIFSGDPDYVPQTAITGFTGINRGLTLSNLTGTKLHGTATNADAVDGISSEQFLRSDENDTTSGTLGVLNDTGFVVGVDSDIKLSVDSTVAKITKQTPGNLHFIMGTDVAAVMTSDETVQFRDGLVTVPPITFVGDDNTGIYHPGPDRVAITANGEKRFEVNTSETEVVGDLLVGGNSEMSGSLLVTEDLDVAGDTETVNLLVTGNTQLGNQAGDSITFAASSLSIPNDLSISGGSIGMTGSLFVGGPTIVQDNFTVSGNVIVSINGTGGSTVLNGSTVANGTFSVNATDANDFVIDSLGRIRVNSASSAAGHTKEGDITLATNGVIHARNTAKYACTFIGTITGLAVAASHHVATVTRTGTGAYTLTLADIFNTPIPMPTSNPTVVGSVNGNGYFYLNGTVNAGDTSISVRTANAAGTATDFTRVMFSIFDGPYT